MINNQPHFKFFFICLLIAFVFERLQNTFGSVNQKKRSAGKRRVFQRVFFYILLLVYLSIVLIDIFTFLTTVKISTGLFLFGFFVYCTGVAVRRAAINALGDMWSVFIEIKSNQSLVKSGIYKYLQHPYYLAVVLELSGFSLLCQSLVGFLLAVFLQGSLLLYRIRIENRILDVFSRRQGF